MQSVKNKQITEITMGNLDWLAFATLKWFLIKDLHKFSGLDLKPFIKNNLALNVLIKSRKTLIQEKIMTKLSRS